MKAAHHPGGPEPGDPARRRNAPARRSHCRPRGCRRVPQAGTARTVLSPDARRSSDHHKDGNTHHRSAPPRGRFPPRGTHPGLPPTMTLQESAVLPRRLPSSAGEPLEWQLADLCKHTAEKRVQDVYTWLASWAARHNLQAPTPSSTPTDQDRCLMRLRKGAATAPLQQ